MKNSKIKICFALILLIFASCSNDDDADKVTLSNEKELLSFQFLADNNAAKITEDIDVAINGTNITASYFPVLSRQLTPTIEVSEGADYSPKGPQDFSQPVIYTITAEDDSTTSYLINIEEKFTTRNLSEIINWIRLRADAQYNPINQEIDGEINDNDNSVIFTFPAGTNVTIIDPEIQIVSQDNTVETGGTILDFSTGEPYIVPFQEQDGSGLYITFDIAYE